MRHDSLLVSTTCITLILKDILTDILIDIIPKRCRTMLSVGHVRLYSIVVTRRKKYVVVQKLMAYFFETYSSY